MLRNRADHLVGTFRDDAQLRRYLSSSCRSLVSTMVDEHDELYWVSEAFISTTADVFATTAPTDMWKLVTLRVSIGARRVRIPRADLDDLDIEAVGQSLGGWTESLLPRFRLMQRRFYWTPTPRAAHQVKVYYVPTTIFTSNGGTPKADLTATDDTFDGIFGWDEWVALDAACKLLSDEKKDTSVLAAERGLRMNEIVSAIKSQALDDPPKVRDRYGDGSDGRPDRMPPGGWF